MSFEGLSLGNVPSLLWFFSDDGDDDKEFDESESFLFHKSILTKFVIKIESGIRSHSDHNSMQLLMFRA